MHKHQKRIVKDKTYLQVILQLVDHYECWIAVYYWFVLDVSRAVRIAQSVYGLIEVKRGWRDAADH